jgi:murein DD-endopeptidase MepM/ murein hydrolase activator NlpD
MTNRLGVYWSVSHRRPADYEYFKRLNPSVMKVMDPGNNDIAWINDNLPDALVVARIHSLSEQHEDMLKDPIGTGVRHAREWDGHATRLGLDRSRTLILGLNEPRIWEPGVPEALRQYTIAMCEEATVLGLRVGAMQLSVGWPNNDGPDTPPNWSRWHGVDNAIRHNNGALVCHEYWADNGPGENWGWWAGRVLKCPWQVPIVIGECGVDIYVKDGSVPHNSRGWRGRMEPERYARELADYTARMSTDSRYVGNAVFASDFASHEWFSFDVEPAYQAILSTPIPTPPTKPIDTHLPVIISPAPVTPTMPPSPAPTPATVPQLAHPIQDPNKLIISQRFGDNPQDYARFGMAGHTGVDYAVPVGTPVVAVDSGTVIEVGDGSGDYGIYIKMRHAWGESLYAHLQIATAWLGNSVTKGEAIGLSGNTGNSTGPHLHFAIRILPYKRGYPFDGYSDPLPYLSAAAPQPSQPSTNVVQLIKAAAQEFGLEWQLLASLAWAESSFNPRAVSSAGAKGLTQLMDATWNEWSEKVGGTDIYNPSQNLRVGSAYLAWLIRQTNGNVYKALHAYVWGIGNILTPGNIPPDEVIAYGAKIVHGRDLLKAVGVQ